MRTCLIPPIPELQAFSYGSGMHLLLAHLMAEPTYVRHYQQLRQRKDYLIMDNAAHENGKSLSLEELLISASKVNAQEIVCPDVHGDGRTSAAWTVEAMRKCLESPYYIQLNRPRLMVVPQGYTPEECRECFENIMRMWHMIKNRLTGGLSVGLPNFMDRGEDAQTHQIVMLRGWLYKTPIHLLGWTRRLWQLRDIVAEFPLIRSVDSARPFVYAMNNTMLMPGEEVPPYPGRSPLYFEYKLSVKQRLIATHNIAAFQWAASTDETFQPYLTPEVMEGISWSPQ